MKARIGILGDTGMQDLPRTADVAIVGGGVMGVSTAYHLATRGAGNVVLLEQNELLGQGATGKCAGGIRHQFATEINVRLSLASLAMLERFEEELGQAIGLRWCGYLFLLRRTEEVAAFRRAVAMQHRLGVMTEWLSREEVAARVPEVRTHDVLAGTVYGRDGLADPQGVVDGYARAARERGARLLTQVRVLGAHVEGGRVRALRTTRGDLDVGAVVNAAGPFARDVGEMLGVDVPVRPLRRQIAVTGPLPGLRSDFPFVIDFTSGLYFHREGPGVLTGMANRDEPFGVDESVDLEWETRHLAEAIDRMPLLERATLAHRWAGLYEVSPDAHPLIGRLEPLENAYVVAGFSGHGFMHGPIAGKLLAEIVLDGGASSLDVSTLAPTRFAAGELVREHNVV